MLRCADYCCISLPHVFGKSDAGSEAEMRNALRFAREKGMEKLQVYKEASLCGLSIRFFPGMAMAMIHMTGLQEMPELSPWFVNV